jgi:hypothetical protein
MNGKLIINVDFTCIEYDEQLFHQLVDIKN